MYCAYLALIIVLFVSVVLIAIAIESDGCDGDVIRAVLAVGSSMIAVISLLTILMFNSVAKHYKFDYDEIIKNIEDDKTKITKENGEVKDIWITVNGQEYHFSFKEDNT